MHAHRLHAGFYSELLYIGLYNPRWLHSPEEYKLKISVDFERLRLKIPFSQPAPPPQYDTSPRRSPAVCTGSDESGLPHAETQQTTEREGIFPFQASVDGFLHVDCTRSPDQEGTNLLQADVVVKPEATTAQAAAREDFARPPKNRQQRRVIAWGAEKTKQFDPGG